MCHLIHFLCAGTVQSVKFVKKGEHCLSTGLDGSLRKWSLLTGKQLFSIPAVVSVQPWPTEQIIVLEPKAMVLSNTQGQVRQLSTQLLPFYTENPVYLLEQNVTPLLNIFTYSIFSHCCVYCRSNHGIQTLESFFMKLM